MKTGYACCLITLLLVISCKPQTSWDESYARGQMLYRQNKYSEALPYASASLNAARYFEDVDQFRILQSLYLLANINDKLNKRETADHFYTRSLSVIHTLKQSDPEQVYNIMRDYSRFLHKQQDLRGALAINAELLDYLKTSKSSIEPYKLGLLYYDQALYYTAYEKYESALTFIKWSVRIFENHYGSGSLRLIDPLYLLSTLYYHTGEYRLGRQTAELGLKIMEDNKRSSNREQARLLMIAAKNIRAQKAVLTARNYYEKALLIMDPSTGIYTPELEQIYSGLSELSLLLREPKKAITYQVLAVNTSEALYGKENTNTLRQLVKLADLYRQSGDEEKALRIEYDVRQRLSALIY
ncbi:MAG TPA: hypothetical protein ENO01_02645 [Candidatus Marinimicrobia bacterium]|nr:hypothetical protein [Candidatus Neomarinimicrobiota bacterium]